MWLYCKVTSRRAAAPHGNSCDVTVQCVMISVRQEVSNMSVVKVYYVISTLVKLHYVMLYQMLAISSMVSGHIRHDSPCTLTCTCTCEDESSCGPCTMAKQEVNSWNRKYTRETGSALRTMKTVQGYCSHAKRTWSNLGRPRTNGG